MKKIRALPKDENIKRDLNFSVDEIFFSNLTMLPFRLVFLCLIGIIKIGFSQVVQSNEWQVAAQYGQGVVLPEYQFVHSLANKPINQLEISFIKQTNGSNYWQQLYKYPKFGIAVLFSTLGNKQVFGDEIALYPFFTLYSFKSPKLIWEHSLGLGLGWATRKFDLNDNYKNIAVGSNLNVHFTARTNLQFLLNDRWKFNAGLIFHHFSNANLKEPNLGINSVAVLSGLVYSLNPKSPVINLEIPIFTPKNEFAFVYSAGGKHTRALQSKVYFTSSMSIEYKRKWKRKFQYGGGLDLFYDAATETEFNGLGKANYKDIYAFRTGIHFSQEFIYNRFSFILQEGIHLLLTDRVNHNIMYNRAIMRYKWGKHFFTHISMKSHLHILDYPECGFAYYF